MLSLSNETKIHVYTGSVDMRKSIDGLVNLLADGYKQNPQAGDLFIFTNKHRNKLKLLFWDHNGFVLYYKRMEKGRFCYSKYLHDDEIMISMTQLKALLMGLDFYLMGKYNHDLCNDFF